MVLVARPSVAATITLVPGAGFDGSTPVAPVGGNAGTTVGAQRLIAVQYAADLLGSRLSSSVEIRIAVSFVGLSCASGQGTLGSAGSNLFVRDFDGAPVAGTWYPVALANAITGVDQCPPSSECTSQGFDPDDLGALFQTNVGTSSCLSNLTWYYGLDARPGTGQIDFVTVALHEFAHGLGFAALVNLASGTKAGGFDDAFIRNLEDHSTGTLWPNMSDSERVTSSTDTGDLHWVGTRVVAVGAAQLTAGRDAPTGHVEMYSPNPAEAGSSVSHFSTSLAPNELMEPFITGPNHNVDLTVAALDDVGWAEVPCGNGVLDGGEECDDGNPDPSDGCTNTCTICGNGIVSAPEQCDDGNLIAGDGCEADCRFTAALPPVDYTSLSLGKTDGASVKCLKAVAREVRKLLGTEYRLLTKCLDGIQGYEASVAAGLSAGDIQAALSAATQRCSEPGNGTSDAQTLLGQLDEARTRAISGIERRCGMPGGTTLQGRSIRQSASGDFTSAEVAAHIDGVSCVVEELIADGYNGAAAALSAFPARASQGGLPLDQYFPCIAAVGLPPVDYSSDGGEDIPSLSCLKAIGQAGRTFVDKKYRLMSRCLDAIEEHNARLQAQLSAKRVEQALGSAEKRCVEPSGGAPDSQTMLGQIAAAATRAISDMQRKCGTPGGTTIDGKSINSSASGDFGPTDLATHADTLGCRVERLIGLGYAGAGSDLAAFTARASQGGVPLNQLLPCTP